MLMPKPGEEQRKICVIGLTGGAGSGKSEAARVLEGMGIPVINADHVGHALIASGGRAEGEVIDAFGPGILSDGRIDRQKLGAVVFADPTARQRLNQIVHPRIGDEIDRAIRELDDAGEALVVIDAALLAEEGMLDPGLDDLVVIQSSRATRIRRLVEMRGLSEEQAVMRIDAQAPPEVKVPIAGWVVPNEETLDAFQEQVRRLGEELIAGVFRNRKMPEVR